MTKIKRLNKYVDEFDIFMRFHEYKDIAFLDSSLKDSRGRYSIIGLNSYLKVEIDDYLKVNDTIIEEDSFQYLNKLFKDNYEKNDTELPIISGAIGYFSYDFGRKIENLPTTAIDDTNIPKCILNFYDNFIIIDNKEKEIYVTAVGKLIDCDRSIDKIEKIIYSDYIIEDDKKEYCIEIKSNFERDQYLKTIDKVKNYIEEGDIYICNLTQRLKVKSNKKPIDVFSKLRRINPSPFGGYIDYDDFKIVSSSPERFLRMKNGYIETVPIKGTRRRGRNEEEDNILREELRNSEKDKSELLMIIDLERNDLSKVCKENSIKVKDLFSIEEYATVFHLVTKVTGKIREDKTVIDLIKATFPGGSITGAPKVRAMEIIEELEGVRRGIYTGVMGYITFDNSCDLSIIIRTILFKEDYGYIGVGGGITYESDRDFEFEETIQKARALLEAMK
ncbi:Aminodeoxychorismate synthase component 1 [Clostridium bornimense]|uniref:Anthranilate synthase component 1 n=1 Tax=Clostridium bornimense TaxID=1216932 RepID=W6RXX3_9CLOT|nr:aminodeoxychorismate synthase component I [Clostridium bornimense]CDM68459.1 Aminodeoxychorismate synthase component 1 [Clostridium bornimense]